MMSPALSALSEDLAAAAAGAGRRLVKSRARIFAARPETLEALRPNLSAAPPAALRALGLELLAQARRAPPSLRAEPLLVCAHALILLGRARARSEERAAPGTRAPIRPLAGEARTEPRMRTGSCL